MKAKEANKFKERRRDQQTAVQSAEVDISKSMVNTELQNTWCHKRVM
jgi:hypothetical protein